MPDPLQLGHAVAFIQRLALNGLPGSFHKNRSSKKGRGRNKKASKYHRGIGASTNVCERAKKSSWSLPGPSPSTSSVGRHRAICKPKNYAKMPARHSAGRRREQQQVKLGRGGGVFCSALAERLSAGASFD